MFVFTFLSLFLFMFAFLFLLIFMFMSLQHDHVPAHFHVHVHTHVHVQVPVHENVLVKTFFLNFGCQISDIGYWYEKFYPIFDIMSFNTDIGLSDRLCERQAIQRILKLLKQPHTELVGLSGRRLCTPEVYNTQRILR